MKQSGFLVYVEVLEVEHGSGGLGVGVGGRVGVGVGGRVGVGVGVGVGGRVGGRVGVGVGGRVGETRRVGISGDILTLTPTLTLTVQRRERDSNPRTCYSQRFSRPSQSTTLPSLRGKYKASLLFTNNKR